MRSLKQVIARNEACGEELYEEPPDPEREERETSNRDERGGGQSAEKQKIERQTATANNECKTGRSWSKFCFQGQKNSKSA